MYIKKIERIELMRLRTYCFSQFGPWRSVLSGFMRISSSEPSQTEVFSPFKKELLSDFHQQPLQILAIKSPGGETDYRAKSRARLTGHELCLSFQTMAADHKPVMVCIM